jgi:hypothetical protein
MVQDGARRAYIDRNAKRQINRVHPQGTKPGAIAGGTHGGVYRRRAVGTLLVHFTRLCELFCLTLLIVRRAMQRDLLPKLRSPGSTNRCWEQA